MVQSEARMDPMLVDRSSLMDTTELESIEGPVTERLKNPVITSPRRLNQSNKGQTDF